MGMLSVTQTAEKMNVHRRTVLNWIKEGKLPYIRIGSDYRIDTNDIEKMKVH
jgi:excisionase family DNA binding protein